MVKAPEQNGQMATELDTFLPQDGSNINGNKYKISVVSKDVEAGEYGGEFDPFKARQLENPTTDCDTLTHLLKASLGTGILAMPVAFMYSGLVVGIFATILVAFLCTHCAYVLVVCAHELYKRTKVTAMSFADVVAVSFSHGPEWCKGFANIARMGVLINLFVTYFGTCSVYSVLIAENFQQVASYHLGYEVNLRLCIALLLVPLILLSWVPDLKYLAPVSMVANVFMALGLGITFYYLVIDLPPIESVELAAPISTFPAFFSIVIFAMEAIGVVMPLENNMKTPQNFTGLCGVLNKGMSGVTLIYIFLGFLGYLRYGADTLPSITLNLPKDEWPAQTVKILIGLAVFCTFGLQFFVCLEIAWNGIKDRFNKNTRLYNYILRTVLVIIAVLIAIAVPTIGPFMGLIGAFCFSILGLLFPVVIETVTFWDQGFGPCYWKIWKNILVTIFGLLALVFGTQSAIKDIASLYT